MKRSIPIILLVILLLSSACQQQPFDSAITGDTTTIVVTKASDDSSDRTIDEPYVFLAEKDFKAWTSISSLEDRFEACQIPQETLNRMTTEALVKSALSYPLNYLIFAYDKPEHAIEL